MKKILLPILIFSLPGIISAQTKDLEYYLKQAEINSPLINKSRNESKLAELDLKQVKSVLSKPEINIEAGALLAPIISHDNNQNRFELVSSGADNYTGYDLAATDGGQYQAMIALKQPLFAGSMFKSYNEKADISKQISENKIVLTVHEIDQLVRYQYILCLKSVKQIENSRLILEKLKEQVRIMKALVDNAIYKQTDLLLLEIENKNHEAEYKNFQAEYRNNLYDLNLICGIEDTSVVKLKDVNFQINPENVINSRFLNTYRLDSLSVKADQRISGLKYVPRLDFFANAGMNATYVPAFNRMGFSTGLTFSWNIFDGHQRSIRQEKSNVNLQTIAFEKKTFTIQNQLQKKKILTRIHSFDQQISITEEQIKQYEKLVKAYTTELPQGEISVMDFKNIIKEIAAKQQENIALQMEKQVLINSYNYWNY